jgi:hypothetical protein
MEKNTRYIKTAINSHRRQTSIFLLILNIISYTETRERSPPEDREK